MFQNYALFPNMTVAQNIGAGAPGDGAEKKRLAESFIRRFYLEGKEGLYPAQLSGGQGQRVALARMLAARPSVILMDEPPSSVDGHLRWQLEKEIRETLADFQGPSLVVSHDSGELYRLCGRMAILDNGRVDSFGEKQSLYEKPATLAGARLTGCKNISRARKHSEYGVEAVDWHEVLTTEEPVRPDIRYVGVQARAFREIQGEKPRNALQCRIEKIFDNVHTEIILAKPVGAAPPDDDASIYWEAPKGSRKWKEGDPLLLQIEAGDILQLGP
jgi:molybdate transport system ATP-binding protein